MAHDRCSKRKRKCFLYACALALLVHIMAWYLAHHRWCKQVVQNYLSNNFCVREWTINMKQYANELFCIIFSKSWHWRILPEPSTSVLTSTITTCSGWVHFVCLYIRLIHFTTHPSVLTSVWFISPPTCPSVPVRYLPSICPALCLSVLIPFHVCACRLVCACVSWSENQELAFDRWVSLR